MPRAEGAEEGALAHELDGLTSRDRRAPIPPTEPELERLEEALRRVLAVLPSGRTDEEMQAGSSDPFERISNLLADVRERTADIVSNHVTHTESPEYTARSALLVTLGELQCFVERAARGRDESGATLEGESYELLLEVSGRLSDELCTAITARPELVAYPGELPVVADPVPLPEPPPVTRHVPEYELLGNERPSPGSTPTNDPAISRACSVTSEMLEQVEHAGRFVSPNAEFFAYLPVLDASVVTGPNGELTSFRRWYEEYAEAHPGHLPPREAFFRTREIERRVPGEPPGMDEAECEFPVTAPFSLIPLSPRFQLSAVSFLDADGRELPVTGSTRVEECVFGGAVVEVPEGAVTVRYRIANHTGYELPLDVAEALNEALPRHSTYRPREEVLALDALRERVSDEELRVQAWLGRAIERRYHYVSHEQVVKYVNAADGAVNEVMGALRMGTCSSLAGHEANELRTIGVNALVISGPVACPSAEAFQVSPAHTQTLVPVAGRTIIHDLARHARPADHLQFDNVSAVRWERAEEVLRTGSRREIWNDAADLRAALVPSQGIGSDVASPAGGSQPFPWLGGGRGSSHSRTYSGSSDDEKLEKEHEELVKAIDAHAKMTLLEEKIERGTAEGNLAETYRFHAEVKIPWVSSYRSELIPEPLRHTIEFRPFDRVRQATYAALPNLSPDGLAASAEWILGHALERSSYRGTLREETHVSRRDPERWSPRISWKECLVLDSPEAVRGLTPERLVQFLGYLVEIPARSAFDTLYPQVRWQDGEFDRYPTKVASSDRFDSRHSSAVREILHAVGTCLDEVACRGLPLDSDTKILLAGCLASLHTSVETEREKYNQARFRPELSEGIQDTLVRVLSLPGAEPVDTVLRTFSSTHSFFAESLASTLGALAVRRPDDLRSLGFTSQEISHGIVTLIGEELRGETDYRRLLALVEKGGFEVALGPHRATLDALLTSVFEFRGLPPIALNLPSEGTPASTILARVGDAPDQVLCRSLVAIEAHGGLSPGALAARWPNMAETKVLEHLTSKLARSHAALDEPSLSVMGGMHLRRTPLHMAEVLIADIPILVEHGMGRTGAARCAAHLIRQSGRFDDELENAFGAIAEHSPESFGQIINQLRKTDPYAPAAVENPPLDRNLPRAISRRLMEPFSHDERAQVTLWLAAVHVETAHPSPVEGGTRNQSEDKRRERWRKKARNVPEVGDINLDYRATLSDFREIKAEMGARAFSFYANRTVRIPVVPRKDPQEPVPEPTAPSVPTLGQELSDIADAFVGNERVGEAMERQFGEKESRFISALPALTIELRFVASVAVELCEKNSFAVPLPVNDACRQPRAASYLSLPRPPSDRRDALTRYLDWSTSPEYHENLNFSSMLEKAIQRAQHVSSIPRRKSRSTYLNYVAECSGRLAPSWDSGELSESVPYVPGMSTNRIDWKAYGRTDQYRVKKFEQEIQRQSIKVVDIEKLLERERELLTSGTSPKNVENPAIIELFTELYLASRERIVPTIILRAKGHEVERFTKLDALPGFQPRMGEEFFYHELARSLSARMGGLRRSENERIHLTGEQGYTSPGFESGLAAPIPRGALLTCFLSRASVQSSHRDLGALLNREISVHIIS